MFPCFSLSLPDERRGHTLSAKRFFHPQVIDRSRLQTVYRQNASTEEVPAFIGNYINKFFFVFFRLCY